jgi:hypothetical protein
MEKDNLGEKGKNDKKRQEWTFSTCLKIIIIKRGKTTAEILLKLDEIGFQHIGLIPGMCLKAMKWKNGETYTITMRLRVP